LTIERDGNPLLAYVTLWEFGNAYMLFGPEREILPLFNSKARKKISRFARKDRRKHPAKHGYVPLDLAQFRDMISAGGLTMI
jgi:hypothetical protein